MGQDKIFNVDFIKTNKSKTWNNYYCEIDMFGKMFPLELIFNVFAGKCIILLLFKS